MTRPSKLRSAVTNNPFVLAGVDGRSATGRRFRDVIDSRPSSVCVSYGFAPRAASSNSMRSS